MMSEVFLAALGGGISGGITGGVIAYVIERLHYRRNKPILKISIKSTNEMLKFRELKIDTVCLPIFRLSVTNEGKSTASNCVVKLRSYLIEDGQEKEESKNTLLHWHRNVLLLDDNTRIGEFKPISIAPGDEEWIDFFYPKFSSEQNEWQLHFVSSHPVHSSAKKEYKLVIAVYGDNVYSDKYKLHLHWDVENDANIDIVVPRLLESVRIC